MAIHNEFDGAIADGDQLNDGYFNAIARSAPPGATVWWNKTLGSVSVGTADTNTVDKLVDSGATFQSDGVVAGMIIRNTTDGTYAVVDLTNDCVAIYDSDNNHWVAAPIDVECFYK